jgi:hypothetical protein
MEVPSQNLIFYGVMAVVLGGVVLFTAWRSGRRAALRSAGWAVVPLVMLAWTGFHDYVDEPLGTILTAAAIPAFAIGLALIAVSWFRTMRRWLSDDA